MHQMQVDIQRRRGQWAGRADHMVLPDFVEKCAWGSLGVHAATACARRAEVRAER